MCEVDKDNKVRELFKLFFGDKNIYGRDVYIYGVDMIPDRLDDLLKDEYEIEDEDELLLAFYDKQGFVLTTKGFYWKDVYDDNNMWELEDIYDVNSAKRILANVIYFVGHSNNVSEDVYLTGIDNVYEFIFAFTGFIRKLAGNEKEDMNMIDKIAEACLSAPLEKATACVYGNPIKNNNSKLNKVKTYFGIPEDEKIFIILDSTILGNGKSGFAIGTDGIYYCQSNKCGKITWNDLKNKTIKKGFSSIKIGELDFVCNAGIEQTSLYAILRNIKSVVNFIDEKEVKSQDNHEKYVGDNYNNTESEITIKESSPNDVRLVAEKYFSDDVFGEKIFLFDKNYDRDAVKYITRHYSLETMEDPLLIFNYKGDHEQGFLITTRRIIWKYRGLSGEWNIKDIGAVDSAKFMSYIDSIAHNKTITDNENLDGKEITIKKNVLEESGKETEHVTMISSTIVNKVDDNGEKIIAVEQPVAVEPVKINQKEQVTKNQKQIEEQNIENRDVNKIVEDRVNKNQKQPTQNVTDQDDDDRIRREEILMTLAEKIERKNTIGVVSLILSIIGLVTTFIVVGIVPYVISLILSVVALSKKGKKKKAATAGLIISLIGTAIWIAEAVILGL